MQPHLSSSLLTVDDFPLHPRTQACDVLGMAAVTMTTDEIKGLRQDPQELATGMLTPSALKAAEDQTLLALVAARDATKMLPGSDRDFGGWGVVVSTEFLGRKTFKEGLDRFQEQGAWGASVKIVPNCSLHSPSSTLSLALSAHGPNLGAGGGSDGVNDAWLAAMGLLTINRVPGVWLVSTESSKSSGKFQAAAWALRPSSSRQAWGRLEIEPDPSETDSDGAPSGGFEIGELLQLFNKQSLSQQRVTWVLGTGLRAHLSRYSIQNKLARAA